MCSFYVVRHIYNYEGKCYTLRHITTASERYETTLLVESSSETAERTFSMGSTYYKRVRSLLRGQRRWPPTASANGNR